MEKFKKLGILTIFLSLFLISNVSGANTDSCDNAGDFADVCTTFTSLGNATLAIFSIMFTGANASVFIQAVIVLAIVIGVWDLMRGNNSYLKRKLEKL